MPGHEPMREPNPHLHGRWPIPMTLAIVLECARGVLWRFYSFDNMVLWLRAPQSFSPRTPMPMLGVTERDGRDIAAYLATLR